MSEWTEGDEFPFMEPILVDLGEEDNFRRYQIAYQSQTITIIGNHFDFDMPKVVRWKRVLNEDELEDWRSREFKQ